MSEQLSFEYADVLVGPETPDLEAPGADEPTEDDFDFEYEPDDFETGGYIQ